MTALRRTATAAALVLALFWTSATAAGGQTTDPDPATSPDPAPAELLPFADPAMSLTVPSLVPGLTVVVTTDDAGHLTAVELHDAADPASPAPPDYVATRVDHRRVRFENDVTGTRVEVKAKHDKLETKVRTSTLADLVGTHTWSGDVLGDAVSVDFTVGDDAGTPTVSVDAVTTLLDHEIRGPKTESDDHEIETEAKIRFTDDFGRRADLKIEVEVHSAAMKPLSSDDGDDSHHDDGTASLKVALKVKDEKLTVPAADLAALPQTWTGALCDGTPVSASWVNGADGTITDLVVTPAEAEVKTKEHGFEVRFADHARLKVSLKVKGDDTVELKIDPKIECHDEDAPDPSVNTPVDESGHDGDHEHGKGHENDHHEHGKDKGKGGKDEARHDEGDAPAETNGGAANGAGATTSAGDVTP